LKIYGPPTPPADDKYELAIDPTHGYLYSYDIIPESELLRVPIKRKGSPLTSKSKKFKKSGPEPAPQLSLFKHTTKKMQERRKGIISQRARFAVRTWAPGSLTLSLVKSAPTSGATTTTQTQMQNVLGHHHHGLLNRNWLVEQDAILLHAVRYKFGFQQQQPGGNPMYPGHRINWEFMADAAEGMAQVAPSHYLKRYTSTMQYWSFLIFEVFLSASVLIYVYV